MLCQPLQYMVDETLHLKIMQSILMQQEHGLPRTLVMVTGSFRLHWVDLFTILAGDGNNNKHQPTIEGNEAADSNFVTVC